MLMVSSCRTATTAERTKDLETSASFLISDLTFRSVTEGLVSQSVREIRRLLNKHT